MPPFSASGMHLAQNATLNGSVPANGTCREFDPHQSFSVLHTNDWVADGDSAQQVSWQSAYWPVMACALAVLLQETGRVIDASFSFSYAIRACPLVCVFDTSMMLLKFVVMLAVGCSPRTAVRHVWYDRFDRDEDDRVRSFWASFYEGFPIMGERVQRSVSVTADNTVEPVSSADPHVDLDHDGDEYMCSGALPAVGDQGPGLADVPLATLRTPDASSISRPPRTTTIFSMDVTEVGFNVTELEHPHEEPPAAPPNDASDTLTEQSQAIADNTATVTAPSPFPNTFMVTARYMDPPPGSVVDRVWRLSMLSFVFGALPQAIKVFAMRGIPVTQLLVAIYFVSFIVPEAFRWVAGPVGQFNLYPLPIVSNAKSFLSSGAFSLLFWVSIGSYMVGLVSPIGGDLMIRASDRVSLFPIGMILATPVTILLLKVLEFPMSFQVFANCSNGVRSCMYDLRMFQHVRTSLVALIAWFFALRPSTIEPYLSFVCLYPASLAGAVWLLWCKSSFPLESDDVNAHDAKFWVTLINILFFIPLCLYIVYRLWVIVYLSHISRRLCGTTRTIGEFAKGTFILINIAGITLCYASIEYISCWTFKPRWVEALG